MHCCRASPAWRVWALHARAAAPGWTLPTPSPRAAVIGVSLAPSSKTSNDINLHLTKLIIFTSKYQSFRSWLVPPIRHLYNDAERLPTTMSRMTRCTTPKYTCNARPRQYAAHLRRFGLPSRQQTQHHRFWIVHQSKPTAALFALNRDVTGTLPSEEQPHPSALARQPPPKGEPPGAPLPFSWDLVAIALGSQHPAYTHLLAFHHLVHTQCTLYKACLDCLVSLCRFSSRMSCKSNRLSLRC